MRFHRFLRAVARSVYLLAPAWAWGGEPDAARSYEAARRSPTPFEELAVCWQAANGAQGIRTWFAPRGAVVRAEVGPAPSSWSLGLEWTGYGRDDELGPVAALELHVAGRRAEYRRGPLVEWYVNDERGVEHGVTLAAPPRQGARGEVVLAFEIDGGLHGELRPDARGIDWRAPDGSCALSYAGLAVLDSDGRALPARRELDGDQLRLRFDDAGARWPVTVDPLIVGQEARLDANEPEPDPGTFLGRRVAIDGATAVVGAWRADQSAGAVYVYTRQPDGSWRWQAKLSGSAPYSVRYFGADVDLEGDTLAVGASGSSAGVYSTGAVFVFRREGEAWSQQATLLPLAPTYGADLGTEVALSGDTLAAQAEGQGDVYVWRQVGEAWTLETRLTADQTTWGFTGGLALEGDRLAIGAPREGTGGISGSGEVYVYERSGTTWTQTIRMPPGPPLEFGYFGESVALDGARLAIGAWGEDDSSGNVHLYERLAPSIWDRLARLGVPGGREDADFGVSVALDADWLAVGSPEYGSSHPGDGVAYLFPLRGDVVGEPLEIRPADLVMYAGFGQSVGLTSAGLVVGLEQGGLSGDSGHPRVFRLGGAGWKAEGALVAALGGGPQHALGASVAALGELVFVGAPGAGPVADARGAVYVFAREAAGWRRLETLGTQATGPGDRFGTAVSADEVRLAVGAPGDREAGEESGAVYVFVRAGESWRLEERLTAIEGGAPSERFGAAVHLRGLSLTVGAPGAGLGGEVHAFRRSSSGWSPEAALVAPGAQAGDELGSALAFDGTRLVAGAPGGTGAGRAHVFERAPSGWSHVAILRPEELAPGQEFGRAVALEAARIAVGAPAAGVAGSVHLFERLGARWSPAGELIPVDASPGARFGSALALEGGVLVAGGPLEASGSGAAWFFRTSGPALESVARVRGDDTSAGDGFGSAVALAGERALIGAPGWDLAHEDEGALYVFEVKVASVGRSYCAGDGTGAACPCANEGAPGSGAGCANSSGSGARLAAEGTQSVSADDQRFEATGLVPGRPAILFVGTDAVAGGAGAPYGDGLRCAGGSLVRLGVAVPGGARTAAWGPGLAAAGGWSPGETRRFQVSYRDVEPSPCDSGFNLTNGLEVTFGP